MPRPSRPGRRIRLQPARSRPRPPRSRLRPPREPPAAAEPPAAPPSPAPATRPSLIERGHVRRRARYLRQLRELQLRDLGGFLVELERFKRERPDLVQAKLDDALRTDAELRILEQALGEEQPVREIRQPGIGGTCPECGALHGSSDRFCARCGHELR